MHRLRLTPSADKAVREFRGKPAAAWIRLEADLKAQGCRAGGYRLLGSDGNWSPYCCKHLYGRWRVITTFEPGIAMVTTVGEHDGPGFYTQLSLPVGAQYGGACSGGDTAGASVMPRQHPGTDRRTPRTRGEGRPRARMRPAACPLALALG